MTTSPMSNSAGDRAVEQPAGTSNTTSLANLDAGDALRDGWATVDRVVIPEDVSAAQRSSAQKLFALGAQIAFNLFTATLEDCEGSLDQQAIDRIDKLNAELEVLLPELHSSSVLGVIR